MASPQDLIRKVVDEAVEERRSDADRFLALSDPEALPLSRAELLYLWDEYRSEMLDYASLGNPLGHRFGPMVNTVSDHLRYYGHIANQGRHLLRWPVEYAKALSESFTGPDEEPRRVLYTEGEREAVRLAVDLAVLDSIRRKPGSSAVAVVGNAHDWLGQTWNYNWDYDPAEAMWDKIAAILIGPTDQSGMLIRSGDARRWILASREKGVTVIYDESMTGFGRTGTLWGQEHTGLVADLTVLGGAVGGGMPLGAVIGPGKYFTGLKDSDVSPQAGNPWACAAGSAILDGVHPGVLAHVEESAQVLSEALDGLVGQFPARLSGYHGWGLLRGLKFSSSEDAQRFPLSARSHGLHLAPAVGDTVILAPILISSTHEVTRGVDLIADTLISWEDA